MGVKKITVCHKRKDCIGCGSCAVFAPRTWSMNESDGLADSKGAVEKGEFFVTEIDEDDLAENIEAAQSCPVQIIRIDGVNN